MTETITREQYIKAYKDAPEIVRAVYDADSTTQVIVEMKKKFQLHIDKAGVLGTEIGYLLLGLTSPDKFVARLKEQGFPEQMVTDIIKEVNDKIFVPLREEMKKGTAQMGRNEPLPPQIEKHFHLQNKIPPPVSSFQPPVPRLLEDHEEPHIEFHKTAPPPPNLPGVIHHPPIIPPPSSAPTQPPPTAPPVPLKPKPAVLATPYSADPYREPVE